MAKNSSAQRTAESPQDQENKECGKKQEYHHEDEASGRAQELQSWLILRIRIARSVLLDELEHHTTYLLPLVKRRHPQRAEDGGDGGAEESAEHPQASAGTRANQNTGIIAAIKSDCEKSSTDNGNQRND